MCVAYSCQEPPQQCKDVASTFSRFLDFTFSWRKVDFSQTCINTQTTTFIYRSPSFDVHATAQLSSMLLSPTWRKLLHAPLQPEIMSQMATFAYPDSIHNGNGTRCCSQRNQMFSQPSKQRIWTCITITLINRVLDQSISCLALFIDGLFIHM